VNEVLIEKYEREEAEGAAYLESIDQAKWNIWRDFKFVYGVDIEFHELELKLTKLKQELENEN